MHNSKSASVEEHRRDGAGQGEHNSEVRSLVGGSAGQNVSRDEIEATIAAIWASFLGMEKVESGDNFLLMGGESLLAMQVISRVRDVYGFDLSIRAVFLNTVGEIATEITSSIAQGICCRR